ncbi:hypothetical protein PS2_024013 [Malus domestica]
MERLHVAVINLTIKSRNYFSESDSMMMFEKPRCKASKQPLRIANASAEHTSKALIALRGIEKQQQSEFRSTRPTNPSLSPPRRQGFQDASTLTFIKF